MDSENAHKERQSAVFLRLVLSLCGDLDDVRDALTLHDFEIMKKMEKASAGTQSKLGRIFKLWDS